MMTERAAAAVENLAGKLTCSWHPRTKPTMTSPVGVVTTLSRLVGGDDGGGDGGGGDKVARGGGGDTNALGRGGGDGGGERGEEVWPSQAQVQTELLHALRLHVEKLQNDGDGGGGGGGGGGQVLRQLDVLLRVRVSDLAMLPQMSVVDDDDALLMPQGSGGRQVDGADEDEDEDDDLLPDLLGVEPNKAKEEEAVHVAFEDKPVQLYEVECAFPSVVATLRDMSPIAAADGSGVLLLRLPSYTSAESKRKPFTDESFAVTVECHSGAIRHAHAQRNKSSASFVDERGTNEIKRTFVYVEPDDPIEQLRIKVQAAIPELALETMDWCKLVVSNIDPQSPVSAILESDGCVELDIDNTVTDYAALVAPHCVMHVVPRSQEEVDEDIARKTARLRLHKRRRKSSVANSEQQYEEMLAWLRDGGAEFDLIERDSTDGVDDGHVQETKGDLLGMITKEDITPGTDLMRIPLEFIITEDMAKESEIVHKINESGVRIQSQHSYLAAYLLQEKHKEERSRWHKYLQLLRVPSEYDSMPIFFKEHERAELVGSYALEMIDERIESLRREYVSICEALPEFLRFTQEEFIWARLVIITRIFGLVVDGKKTSGLVPLADMIRHGPTMCKWSFDPDTSAFCIRARRHMYAGDPCFINYGRKCNSRFFVNYGFVVDDNPDNQARLSPDWDLVAPDPSRRNYFRSWGSYFSMPTQLRLGHDATDKDSTVGALTAIRRACSTDEENLVMAAIRKERDSSLGEDGDIVSKDQALYGCVCIENEQRLLPMLEVIIHQQLAKFPTTLEEDEAILHGEEPLSRNKRNAVRMRAGEKRVLHEWLGVIPKALEILERARIMLWSGESLKPLITELVLAGRGAERRVRRARHRHKCKLLRARRRRWKANRRAAGEQVASSEESSSDSEEDDEQGAGKLPTMVERGYLYEVLPHLLRYERSYHMQRICTLTREGGDAETLVSLVQQCGVPISGYSKLERKRVRSYLISAKQIHDAEEAANRMFPSAEADEDKPDLLGSDDESGFELEPLSEFDERFVTKATPFPLAAAACNIPVMELCYQDGADIHAPVPNSSMPQRSYYGHAYGSSSSEMSTPLERALARNSSYGGPSPDERMMAAIWLVSRGAVLRDTNEMGALANFAPEALMVGEDGRLQMLKNSAEAITRVTRMASDTSNLVAQYLFAQPQYARPASDPAGAFDAASKAPAYAYDFGGGDDADDIYS